VADLAELTEMLTDSIYTPMLEQDPAYIALRGKVGNYITYAVRSTGYTLELLPVDLEYYVTLLVQKQLFRILAVARAPEFNIESEFTKVAKGDRFKHYMDLNADLQQELKLITGKGLLDTMQTYTVLLANDPYDRTNGVV